MGGTQSVGNLRDELVRLERALAARDASAVPGGLASLIAADFLEFGQSGRVWDATSVVELLDAGTVDTPASVPVVIEDAAVDVLAADVALVTYRLVVTGQPDTNRSSVWVRRDGRWQLRFHQGTRRS